MGFIDKLVKHHEKMKKQRKEININYNLSLPAKIRMMEKNKDVEGLLRILREDYPHFTEEYGAGFLDPHPIYERRAYAIKSLTRITRAKDRSRVIQALVKVINDDKEAVTEAIEGIGKLGDTTNIPFLREIKDPYTKTAKKSIEQINRRSPEYKRKKRKKAAEEKRKEKRRKERDAELRKKLFSNGDNIFIDQFTKQYSYRFNDDELDKLKNLMRSKGYVIRKDLLRILIDESLIKQKYQNFKARITYNSPENVEGYVKNYVELYGENYETNFKLLEEVLTENGFFETDYKLEKLIKDIIKNKELIKFEKNLLKDSVITMNDLDKFKGSDFEDFLKILFTKMGYEVENTTLSRDQGADLILTKFGNKTVVQAKRWKRKVGNRAVQEITAAINHYNANEGMVVTNSDYTKAAKELAMSNNIKLINRPKLDILIQENPVNKNELS